MLSGNAASIEPAGLWGTCFPSASGAEGKERSEICHYICQSCCVPVLGPTPSAAWTRFLSTAIAARTYQDTHIVSVIYYISGIERGSTPPAPPAMSSKRYLQGSRWITLVANSGGRKHATTGPRHTLQCPAAGSRAGQMAVTQ